MTAVLLFAVALLVWFSLRYAWWRPLVDYRYPRILMYHMISPPLAGARFNGLRVSPAMFEWQLRWLMKRGWTSCTVSELLEASDGLANKSFALTFDDGYADNLLRALPLLKRYRCKATLYLVVERFNRDWSVSRKAHHDEGELQREPKLSDDQVREMLASGLVELGSHSMTHANFLHLDDGVAERELRESKLRLEENFGVRVRSFAWPFGLFRPSQVELVRRAGYASCVTTCEGIDSPQHWDPMQLRRIKISGRDKRLAFLLRMRTGRRGWR
jgi:peptidoglycan/xylan/chitin deacetylase (PgdA/CDA1 family)